MKTKPQKKWVALDDDEWSVVLFALNKLRNSRGYTPITSSSSDRDANRITAESQNELRGITRAQEEAMLAGFLFGWDKPAAKPWNYEPDGSPRTLPPSKNGRER
jgi:hypothetical protein